MKVRIILVEPHEAGNVGAVARAMKNFGLRDLVIVGPRPQRIDDISEWWAKGAVDVVQEARHLDTLPEALADVHLSVATTAVRGRHVAEQLTPFELARLAEETLGEEHRLALVFGREEWGLRGPEIALCQRTASIPTSSDYPTMNLAQSVVIFCYELAKGLRSRAKEPDPAPGELLEALRARSHRMLEEVNFFGNKSPERMCAETPGAGRPGRSFHPRSLDAPLAVAHIEKAIHNKP